jgi:hypothetical protein
MQMSLQGNFFPGAGSAIDLVNCLERVAEIGAKE